MKVLKKGGGFKIEKECTGWGNGGGGCGSILELEAQDIGFTSRSDYLGDTDTFYTFRCCECGVLTDIPSKELPSWVMDEAKTRRISLQRILKKEGSIEVK